jgi:uncharacterized protein YaeQ
MALKATIYKVAVQVSDLDRNEYSDHNLTIARHPSETDERMMVRVLAFALNAPPTNDRGYLEFGKDLWDADEPPLWRKDLTGLLVDWIEVGQPDEKLLLRVSSRAERVVVYCYGSASGVWWSGLANKMTRAKNLTVWQVPAEQSEAMGALAKRSMDLQVTIQEGSIWVGDGEHSVEIGLRCLFGGVTV